MAEQAAAAAVANVANAANAANANPNAANPTFSLHPASGPDETPYDYINNPTHAKLYNKAVEALPEKIKPTPASLRTATQYLKQRAHRYGWNKVLEVGTANGTKSLLTQYASVTLAQVQAFADTFTGTPTKRAQLDAQLYVCLHESLAPELVALIATESDKYHRGDDYSPSGICLWKLLIVLSSADTKADAALYRARLHDMPKILKDHRNNLTKTFAEIREIVQALAARDERTDDLLTPLLSMLRDVPDQEFQEFLRFKKFDWFDNRSDMTSETLMTDCEHFYNLAKRQGRWLKASPEQELITALQAQLKEAKASTKNKEGSKNSKDSKSKKEKNKGKDTSESKPKADKDDKFAWKKVAPKGSDPKKKTVNDKEYHWCPHHKAWTLHTPEKCRLKDEESTSDTKSTSAKPKLTQAMTAVLESMLEDDE